MTRPDVQCHSHCSQIKPIKATTNKQRYVLNTFCTTCPDAVKIPPLCELSCGFPHVIIEANCIYANECPCNHPDTPERAEALARWSQGNAERAVTIKQAVGK